MSSIARMSVRPLQTGRKSSGSNGLEQADRREYGVFLDTPNT
jgi:hypothetical protein